MHEQALTRVMTLAAAGRREEWDPITRALRDELVDHARTTSPYWAEVAPPGTPFEAIPPLTKAVMQERWDDLLARNVAPERWVPGVTSGSGGEPTRFLVDADSHGAQQAGRNALMLLCGIPFDTVTSFMVAAERPMTPLPEGWVHFSSMDLTPPAVARLVEHWSGLGRYVLFGRSSGFGLIVESLEALGGPRPDPAPLAVIASSDTMTPDLRRRTAAAFGCPVHLWYGSRETCGYLAAEPATDAGGYAFNPFLCHIEVVGDDDRPLPPGELGRVLITDLINRVLPMLRYDIGDLGRMARAGRGAWPVLAALEGRSSELLRRADGSPLTVAELGHRLFGVNDHTRWVSGYQFFQDIASGGIEMRVVWRERPDAPTVEQILADMRPAVGVGTPLRIVPVERLETLPSGKRWVVRRA